MLKKFLCTMLSLIVMFSIVSCSQSPTETASKASDAVTLNLENSVSLLDEGLTSMKNRDANKFVSIFRDSSDPDFKENNDTDLNEYKALIKESFDQPNQQAKDFKILDKNEVTKEYIALYAHIEWVTGDIEEVKFKVMPKNGKLMVHLKAFGDKEVKVIKEAN